MRISCFVESRLLTFVAALVVTVLLSDFAVMNKTVALAKSNNVLVGAHPSLPDLQGFGRREMAVEPVSKGISVHVNASKHPRIARMSWNPASFIRSAPWTGS